MTKRTEKERTKPKILLLQIFMHVIVHATPAVNAGEMTRYDLDMYIILWLFQLQITP